LEIKYIMKPTCITLELPPKSWKVTDGFLASISFHFFFFFGVTVVIETGTDGCVCDVLGSGSF
jgi:hypothetical protein